MSYSFAGLLPLLIQIPIWIGLWIGVVGIGKRGRRMEWWFMLTGIIFITVGGLATMVLLVMLTLGVDASHTYSYSPMPFYAITSWAHSLGYILFVIGFAIHGQRSSRVQERILELETIANAQGEELARSQQGYDS